MKIDDSTQLRREASRALQTDERVGTLVHAVLGSLLRRPQPIELFAARRVIDAYLPQNLAPVYRQSLRQRVVSSVLIYETEFRRPDWRFAGAESILEDSALDLVWVTPGGRVFADEVKVGLAASQRLDQLTAQCRAQFAAGVSVFGRRFAGVRAVLIAERREGMVTAGSQGRIAWTT